jgi:hypothetical protein
MPRWTTPLLLLTLLLCGAWSTWQWLRPYETGQDSPWQVNEVSVRRDHGSAWLEIELMHWERKTLAEPPLSRLISDDQLTLDPADARISHDQRTCQIRYWLKLDDLSRAWQLQLPQADLRIKHSGEILLENNQRRTFRQPHW